MTQSEPAKVYLVTKGQMSDSSLEIMAVFSTQEKAQTYIASNCAEHPVLWITDTAGKPAHDYEWYAWRDADIRELILDKEYRCGTV